MGEGMGTSKSRQTNKHTIQTATSTEVMDTEKPWSNGNAGVIKMPACAQTSVGWQRASQVDCSSSKVRNNPIK